MSGLVSHRLGVRIGLTSLLAAAALGAFAGAHASGSATRVSTAGAGQPASLVVDGKRTLRLWVVTTLAGRTAGVNGHPLSPGEGMWFGWPKETTSSFWMHGVRSPLILVWVGRDRRVIGLRRMAPCIDRSQPCPLYRPPSSYRFAIEVRPADLRRSALRVGSAVRYTPLRAQR
jgi:uncharacterized membrane protein (UPF0127 family)